MLNGRAVSEVVGALIMITLAIVAGVVVYVYSSGLIGPLAGIKVQQPYMEKITLDYYNWTSTAKLILILRNTGSAQITLADFFIEGNYIPLKDMSFGTGCSTVSTTSLYVNAPGCQVTLLYSNAGLSFTLGVAYNVRVVTADGAIFDFSCIAGSTS